MIVRNFVLCAVCAGLVGVLEAVRTTVQPDPAGANEVLFGGIAAAVIGGTLLAGGSGTVVGGLIGALLLGILNDGLIIKGVNADYLSFYLGLAIIIAMAANTYIGRVRRVRRVSGNGDILRVEHISKRFGPVEALRDVSLRLRKGEVLGLLGDNGTGKSTLMKIICGFEKADSGQMFLRGEPYEPKSVDHARSLGIDTVYQDLALIDELSVFQNMFLRRERVHRPLPFLANRSMRSETREALDEIGIDIRNLNQPVARLSGGSGRRSPSRAR